MITEKLKQDFEDVQLVILGITNNCNLKCRYCFVNQDNHSISLDKCYKIIDLLNNGQNKSLVFFGGEPLLLFNDIIVPTVKYAISSNIHFSITTNGTLLTKNNILFLKDHNIDLLLSMDGNKDTQNYNRPSKTNQTSYDLIEKNIPLILKYFPNIEVRATLYPATAQLLFDNYNFFISQGFKTCFFCPDSFSIWTNTQKIALLNELQKISLFYISSFQNNILPPTLFLPYETMLNEILSYNSYQKMFCITCGENKSKIAIDYQGNIFNCQELITYQTNIFNNLGYIGNIEAGIDTNKYSQIQQKFQDLKIQCEDNAYCQNICKIHKYCDRFFCYANSYLQFNQLNIKNLIECEWENMIYNECLKISLLLNQNQLFLKHYLNINQEGV